MTAAVGLELRVNGANEFVRASANQTLLEILRDGLRITGPKRGCNQGVCGACTVLVDQRPVRSCLSLALNLQGREITTIEGLSDPQHLSKLQQAIIACGAVQCGFRRRNGGRRSRSSKGQPTPLSSRSSCRLIRQSMSLFRLHENH